MSDRQHPRGVTMSYHMVMNLSTALEMAYNHPEWNYDGMNGVQRIRAILNMPEDTTQSSIINDLNEMKDKGFEVIPGCDGHLPNGRCPGHVKRGVHAGKLHR